ncbi:helix-turn-helix domain-containing protein [Streptomyces sp. NPDC005244]|uniref:helix-turn-helix domain-containing protein n=1 Tax=Streptomyces sp. NPDC005244 TaxID=3364708 RepID=UPI0036C15F23
MEIFEKISMASIEIMTTGRIELSASGRAVAANVKRLRAARGMSLRALSESLGKIGRNLSTDAINKIENGSEKNTTKQIRRVDVDDLVALSIALGVSPATLLLPQDARGTAEVTGAGEVEATLAWRWVWCEEPLTLPEGDEEADRATVEFLLNSRPIGLFLAQGDDRIAGAAGWRHRRQDSDG